MSPTPPPLPGRKNRLALYLLLGIAVLALLGFGGIKLAQKVKRSADAHEAFKTYRKENADDLRKVVESEDSVTEGVNMLDAAQKKLGVLADKMPPLEKNIMLAGQEVMTELQGPLKTYQTSYADLLQSESFSAAGLKTLADIDVRRKKVQVFSDANDSLKAAFVKLGDRFAEKLKARGLSSSQCESAKVGYLKSAHTDLVAQIREDDSKLCREMFAVLDLYKDSWGKWKLDSDGKLIFEKSADLDRYNQSMTTIQEIAKDQADVQQKMLAAQQSDATK